MSLQENISKDLQTAIQRRNTLKANVLKVIVGELQRAHDKDLTDAQVIAILKKLVKDEQDVLKRLKQDSNSGYLNTLLGYIPPASVEEASIEEIKEWILANVSQETLASKQKFSCTKAVLAYFGERTTGIVVRQVLEGF